MKQHTRLNLVAGLDVPAPAKDLTGRRAWGRSPKQGCRKLRGQGGLWIETLAKDMRSQAESTLRRVYGWQRITQKRHGEIQRMAEQMARNINNARPGRYELWLNRDGTYTPDFIRRERRMRPAN